MASRAPLLLSLALCAGCPRSGADAPTVGDDRASSSTLILYRDAAELRTRRDVRFDATGSARLEGLATSRRMRVRGADGAVLGERVVPRTDESLVTAGDRVIVVTDSGRVEGRFESWTRDGVLLHTADGPRLVAGELRLVGVRDRAAAVTLVGGPADQTRSVEISSWLEGLVWSVAYTAVIAEDNQRAHLHGWLSIDGRAATTRGRFRADRLIIVDDRATSRSKSDPARPAADAPVTLSMNTALADGAQVRLPILRGPREVPATVTRVFDPIGRSVGHQGIVPIRRAAYGTKHDRQTLPVSLSIRLDLPARLRRQLPGGPVTLFARGNGTVRALGVTSGFGTRRPPTRDLLSDGAIDAQSEDDKREPESAGELRIGVAPGLSGRRWQEEVHVSEARRRVVEEIRIELENSTEQDAAIDVVEHMIRGLNWSLAYHNRAGVPTKRGPQEVVFATRVPAESTVLVMYRVVYTW